MSNINIKNDKKGIISRACNSALLYASSLNIVSNHLFKQHKVSELDLIDNDELVDSNLLVSLLCKIDDARPNSNSSLQLATFMPLSVGGSVSRIAGQSNDLKTAMELFVRGAKLTSDQADAKLIHTDDELIFQMNHELDTYSKGLLPELGLGIAYKVMNYYFGSSALNRVCFQHLARGPLANYTQYFKVPIQFDCKHNALVFDNKKILCPNIKHESVPKSILMNQLDELLRERGISIEDNEDNYLTDVYSAIKTNAALSDYSVSGLAEKLSTSPRNLQRNLKQNNTNARKLLDDVRYNNALILLDNGDKNLIEIAEKLGFKSERGFKEFFKKRSGINPMSKNSFR